MIWFGSSAGVALSGMYPEARSVTQWLKGGWHIVVGFVAGYLVMLAVVGWHPQPLKHTGIFPSTLSGVGHG